MEHKGEASSSSKRSSWAVLIESWPATVQAVPGTCRTSALWDLPGAASDKVKTAGGHLPAASMFSLRVEM